MEASWTRSTGSRRAQLPELVACGNDTRARQLRRILAGTRHGEVRMCCRLIVVSAMLLARRSGMPTPRLPPYYLALGDSLALGIQPNPTSGVLVKPTRATSTICTRSIACGIPVGLRTRLLRRDDHDDARRRRLRLYVLGTQLVEAARVHQDPSCRAHYAEHRRRQRASAASTRRLFEVDEPAWPRASAPSRPDLVQILGGPAHSGRPLRADCRDELLRSVPRGMDAGHDGKGLAQESLLGHDCD